MRESSLALHLLNIKMQIIPLLDIICNRNCTRVKWNKPTLLQFCLPSIPIPVAYIITRIKTCNLPKIENLRKYNKAFDKMKHDGNDQLAVDTDDSEIVRQNRMKHSKYVVLILN